VIYVIICGIFSCKRKERKEMHDDMTDKEKKCEEKNNKWAFYISKE